MDKKKRIALIVGTSLVIVTLIAAIWVGIGKQNESKITTGDKIEQSEQANKLPNNYEESENLMTEETKSELVITSDMILENAMFVKNNDMESPGEIAKSKKGVELKIEGAYNGLKCLFVKGMNLPTSGVDTMSIRIRSLGEQGFTRFRLYLCSTPSEKMDTNKVIDNGGGDDAIYPELVNITKADAEGWQTVTIKVGQLPYWKHTTNVTGFNFAFLSKDDIQEVSDIRFNVGGKNYKDATFNYTSGDFSASVLYKNAVAIKNNNIKETGTAKLTDDGVQYTITGENGAVYNGLKSIYVDNIALNPTLYDTMTVRIRSLGSGGFTRFRLYLNSKANEKADAHKLIDTGGDSPIKANLLSVTNPDGEGWQTVTIKVGELDFWKKSNVITAFNFGYLSKDAVQEIQEIRFTKRPITYKDSEKAEETVQFTSGNFTKDVLYREAVAIMNNNVSATGTQELKDTGVVYTMAREDQSAYNGLKSIYVDKIALDTSAYDRMTIRLRSIGETDFTRFRLYLNVSEYDKTDTNKLLDTGGDPTQNADLLTITEPDEDGWQIVTIHVAQLDFWKKNSVIRAFNFGYVNTGNVQEVSQIIFSKGAPELDLSGKNPEEDDNTGDDTPTEYTQGSFPADILVEYGNPVYNNNPSLNVTEELNKAGDAVTYTFTESNALKSVYLEKLSLDPDMFDKMTVRLRSLDGGNFGIFRLYLSTEKEESLASNKVVDSNNADFYKELVNVKKEEVAGVEWTVVTIELKSLPAWTGAQVIKGMNFGYTCHPGTQQQIAEIQLSANVGGEDEGEDAELGSENQANIASGVLSADVLYAVSSPIYNNKEDDTTSQKALSSDEKNVKYTFEKGLAEKSIVIKELNWKPFDFSKMTVRLKSDTAFDRFRLYLNDEIYGEPILDVKVDGTTIYGSTNINGDKVSIDKDSENWITVTIDVENVMAWTSETRITAFRFSYVNEGSVQEVREIRLTKKDGVFDSKALYALGASYDNNTAKKDTQLTETGVSYKIVGANGAAVSRLKNYYVNGVSLRTAQFDTMTIKLRTWEEGATTYSNPNNFTRFRLYLNTGGSNDMDENKELDTGGNPTVNADLLSVGEADENGWFTVTIKVGELDFWKNNAVITGFNFGYVNTQANQEIAEIKFSKQIYVVTVGAINNIGTPIWNRQKGNYGEITSVTTNSLAYSFATLKGQAANTANNGSLRGLYLNFANIDVPLQQYDTMEFKIKPEGATQFDHMRFYYGKDGTANLYASNASYEAIGTNVTVSQADENGWFTVMVNLNGISGWSSANSIDDIYIGYVPNPRGNTQSIGAITFRKSE